MWLSLWKYREREYAEAEAEGESTGAEDQSKLPRLDHPNSLG